MVRKSVIGSMGVLFLVFSSGCEHMSNTAKGGLVGGGVGAGAGALIGSASGNAGKGAVIGGLGGTLLGGLVGNDVDQQEKRQRERDYAISQAQLQEAQSRPTQAPLGLTDIQQLAASGTSDQIIINQIRTTGSTYQLSATDIQWLKTNGVSDTVILEMQNAKPRVVGPVQRTTIIREEPTVIYHRRPPVYVYPYPPPPTYGVGVIYRR
jgi:hypothetical protein